MIGSGTVGGLPFAKVLDRSAKAGLGPRLYEYSIFVEMSIPVSPERFARDVHKILADERGWTRGGEVSFQRVEEGADTFCVLATPDTVDKLCAPLDTAGEVSCCQGARVVINWHRWRDAVEHWTGTVEQYRQMVVNHEFGHRIGKGHGFCEGAGKVAPVMQQQTYGLQGCRRNSWPKRSEL